jgi:hypothetical protein
MAAEQRQKPAAGRSYLRSAILLVSGLWLLVLLTLLLSPVVAAADSSRMPANAGASPTACASCAPTATTAPTDTPTTAPAPTPTDTPVPAATSAPPTATPTTTSGGASNGGSATQSGPLLTGPDVTRVVFAQPTAASDTGGTMQGLASSAVTSNGLLVAATLSCVTALLGLTVAVIALVVLVRGGYGPFLRGLLPRWLRRRGDSADFASSGDDQYGGWDTSAESREWQSYGQPPQRGWGNAPSYPSRGAPASPPPGYGPPPGGAARQRPSATRRPSDWR